MVSARRDAVRVAPGLPDFGSESAAVGHGQADDAGAGAAVLGSGAAGAPSRSVDSTGLPGEIRCRAGCSVISLWVHAKRHYDLAATTAYWRARMHKELMKALGG